MGDGGGGAVVEGVLGFAAGGAEGAAPEDFAGGAVDGEGDEIVVLGAGEEDAVADEDRGGFAFGEIGFPEDVLGGAELGGHLAAGGTEAGAIGSAELGPIGAVQTEREEEEEAGTHDLATHGNPGGVCS